MKSKDLFGNDFEYASELLDEIDYVKSRDEIFLGNKAQRLKHLKTINPDGLVLAGGSDFVLIYRELQLCYIDGNFLATIVLAQAFVEKIVHSYFIEKKLESVADRGLYQMIVYLKKTLVISDFAFNLIDNLRLIRNPITHLKKSDYKHSLDNRSKGNSPMIQLEKDAKMAIEVATFFTVHDLNKHNG